MHVVLPFAREYFPAVHGRQALLEAAPVAVEKYPVAHAMQAVAFETLL
jgi:hypothetical protein